MPKNFITTLIHFLNRNKLVIITSICLVFVPFIRLHGFYDVGGDDTRLYYIFPGEMLRNFVGNIVSNNTLGTNGGYESVSFFIPVLLIISGLKHVAPYINTQLLMYGANLAGGFLFFYLFTGLWTQENEKGAGVFSARFVSSLFYILSLFVIKTVFSAQLLAIYMISIFPAVFYLFIRAVKENKVYHVVLSAVVYSAFSSTFLTLPWFGAMAFASIPIFIILIKNYFSSFVKMTLIFFVLVAGLNFYWLFHQVYPLVAHTGGSSVIASVSSSVIKANNVDLIQSLSHLNDPINQLSAYIRSSWDERNNMDFAQSYGVLYFAVILLAGIRIRKIRKYIPSYVLSVAGLLFSFALVTPNFGDWNVAIFTFFNNHIPLFAMFRNMYDKFGIAVSFQFAFALCMSLVVLVKTIKKKHIMNLLIVLLFFTTIWSARNYFFPPTLTDDTYQNISGNFNPDFMNLISYVRSMHEPSRFAWLPLNFASYVVIEDKENPGHYYYGASPMQFLAGISDFAGFQSFATTADPDLNFQMLGYLHNGQYEKIGEILQRMSVKYIIVSRYSLPKAAYDHLNFEGTIDAQKPAYNKLILGDKIKDFGTRYSLYSINKRFTTDKIFLTNNTQSIPADIAVPAIQKSYPYQYDITIHFKEGRTNLAFLEPFDGSWDLFAVDSQGHEYTVNNATHFMIYRFGNGWSFELPKIVQAYPKTLETVNGQKQIHLRIYFHVQKYVQFINEVSVVFWIGIAGYLVIMGIVRFVIFRRNAI